MRLWIALASLAFCAGTCPAQSDEYEWYGLDSSNFQSEEYQLSAENKDDNLELDNQPLDDSIKTDKKVNENKDIFYSSFENVEEEPDADALNDYQFEDNRSEVKDEQKIVEEPKEAEHEPTNDEGFKEDAGYEDIPKIDGLVKGIANQPDDANTYDLDESSVIDPILNENQEISGESNPEDLYDALEEDENKHDMVDDILNQVFSDAENTDNIQKNIDGLKQANQLVNDLGGDLEALEEVEDDEMNKSIERDESASDDIGEEEQNQGEVENGPEDVSEQLNLSEVFDKLEVTAEHDQKNDEINDEEQRIKENITNISESNDNTNEKHVRTVEMNDETENDEDTVDKVYADLDDDLKTLFETWDKLQKDNTVKQKDDGNIIDYEDKYGKAYREENILSQREYDDVADDVDNTDDEDVNEERDEIKNNFEMNDEIKDSEDAPVFPGARLFSEKSSDTEHNADNDAALYSSDSSITPGNEKNQLVDVSAKVDEIKSIVEISEKDAIDTSTLKTIAIDNLTSEQYDDLMKQFLIVHSEDLDIKSGDHIAPVHMTITADEAVVIESPDYPNFYPTNNVIDYYFDGTGSGIEFNITDFSVNGVFGDYLLVKPGGVDASGTDGLVFSYHLNDKRQYRFLDVDRLFVRFFAHPGIAMFKGFQFSVRMISPPKEDDKVQPDPEPLLPPPASFTVTLGGTSLAEFGAIQEDFRVLIADMATVYINANGIDAGLNTTLETAQVTKTSICNVNWPGYESCVEVVFGVPLVYDDEKQARLNQTDLVDMWSTYALRDPFAARLRRMGITEFASPNDGRVMTVWLVIAAGVVISMAMLAFALWRFSCFEDYTRMPAYSDTDSINEKRVLDMYPTPHQTFPALYGEQQLKWDDGKFDDSARVDMGGFANRNYVRDDLMDMDSDEDIITAPRDRNSFSPRDTYQV